MQVPTWSVQILLVAIRAAKGGAPSLSSFEIQSPKTEAFLPGCLAQRFPHEQFVWNTENMRIAMPDCYLDPAPRMGSGF